MPESVSNLLILILSGESVTILTLFLFNFLDSLVNEHKRNILLRIVFAVLNGAAVGCALSFYQTDLPLVLLIFLLSLLLAAEYKCFSKDSAMVYYFLGSSVYFNYITLDLISYSVYRISPLELFDVTDKVFHRMVFIVTNLSTLTCFIFFKTKFFPGKEIKELIHSKERNLLCIWLPIANTLLTLFSMIFLPAVQTDQLNRTFEISLYTALLLWCLCCFISVYIIVLYQGYQIRKRNKMQEELIREQEHKEKLKEQADRHPLTDLLNRRAWEREVKKLLEKGAKGYIVMMDLDHFKDVNDNLGHQEGDRVLKETADILRQTFRTVDIIGHIGGDEFCVFLAGDFSKEIVDQRLEQVSSMRRSEFPKKSGDKFYLSLSAGYSKIPKNGKMPEMLIVAIAQADAALYWQKEHGRNGYAMFRDDMDTNSLDLK